MKNTQASRPIKVAMVAMDCMLVGAAAILLAMPAACTILARSHTARARGTAGHQRTQERRLRSPGTNPGAAVQGQQWRLLLQPALHQLSCRGPQGGRRLHHARRGGTGPHPRTSPCLCGAHNSIALHATHQQRRQDAPTHGRPRADQVAAPCRRPRGKARR